MTDTAITGRPLSAEVIRIIRMRHAAKVPLELRQPNGLTPLLRGFMPNMLAYSPKDGRRLGSLAERDIADHRGELVVLDNRSVPTVAMLAAIRVTDDGRVVQ
jgi:hypothetical protein